MTNPIYTVFLDIDGTILYHHENFGESFGSLGILPGAIEKLIDWHRKGYRIILTTGRPESYREKTLKQLTDAGLIFDQLIMDCGCGPRVLVNDNDPTINIEKALSFCLTRNTGIKDLPF